MAISGVGVAMATAGGVIVYAGLRGTGPLEALREVVSGRTPAPISGTPGAPQSLVVGPTVQPQGLVDPSIGAGPLPQLCGAALTFQHDKYSQTRRWQNGYSDCSSFVGKSFRAIGITPPGASVTGSYLTWSMLRTIQRAEVGAGDLLVTTSHIAIAMSPGTAIGQENPRVNVRIGTIDDIMAGTGAVSYLRYTGTVRQQGPKVGG